MRTETAGLAEQRPLGSRPHDPAASYRRGELAAGLATAALAVQLLFAQVTLLTALALVIVGRLSRWRPGWLAVLAVVSLGWLLTVGVGRAAAGLSEGTRRLAGYLVAAAVHPGRLAHPAAAIAGAGTWLPRQVPLALLAATGEAWLVLWLGWWRRAPQWQWRPGVIAALRRLAAERALAAGRTVTTDGFALGVVAGTGQLADVSWTDAARGVLLIGQDAGRLGELGLAIAGAALRRRKTVLIAEQASQPSVTSRVRELATSHGVPVAETGAAAVGDTAPGDAAGDSRVSAVIGWAVRRRGTVLIAASCPEEAEQAARGLARVLADLADLRLRADFLAWVTRCEFISPASLAELLALGTATGTTMVFSTTSSVHAVTLARAVGVMVVSGPVGAELALDLTAPAPGGRARPDAVGNPIGRESADDAPLWAALATSCPLPSMARGGWVCSNRTISHILAHQQEGEFTVLTGIRPDSGPERVTTTCRVVPMTPAGCR
jgi:hypothetical protein